MSIEQRAKELLSHHSKDYDEPSRNIHCSGALRAIEAALRLRDFTELQLFDAQLSAAYSAGSNGDGFDLLTAKESVRAALEAALPVAVGAGEDAKRLDFLIDQCAYVTRTQCGRRRVSIAGNPPSHHTERDTAREAIDAAMTPATPAGKGNSDES